MSTDPLFMKIGNQYYWYHNDHLGTPQMMTTSSGAVVWSAKYTSFGKSTVDLSSNIMNPFRFPGQYEDTETRLHYNYHRYFDSTVGIYIKLDPIGFKSNDINLYRYSWNSPIGYFDNDGRFVRTKGCSETQRMKIESAVKRIREKAKCCKELSGGKAKEFEKALSQLTVTCVQDKKDPTTGEPLCGFATGMTETLIRKRWKERAKKDKYMSPRHPEHTGPYDPYEIEITELGLNSKKPCGLSFDQLIAHEVAHNAGMKHISQDINDIGIEGCF